MTTNRQDSSVSLNNSEYFSDTEPPLMSFTKLVIDESKITGHQFFRLAERTGEIIVSENIKEHIEDHIEYTQRLLPEQAKDLDNWNGYNNLTEEEKGKVEFTPMMNRVLLNEID